MMKLEFSDDMCSGESRAEPGKQVLQSYADVL